MQQPPVATIGYEKRSLAAYISILQSAHVGAVVDVRETAWSHKPGFSKKRFSEGLGQAGIDYIHARFAGAPKAMRPEGATHAEIIARYREHVAASPDIVDQLDQLIGECVAQGKRVALTCFERLPADCHRSVLADELAERKGWRIEHLGVDD